MSGSALNNYWEETRRPVYSAALVLPFFVVYHVGTLVFGQRLLNGADYLIIKLLSIFSIHTSLAGAFVLVGCFVWWQCRTKAKWAVEGPKLAAMFVESVVVAVVLIQLMRLMPAPPALPGSEAVTLAASFADRAQNVVLYCGAGVYEELVFRVFLLGLLLMLFTKVFHFDEFAAAVWTVVIGAALFSVFHYIGPEEFDWRTFVPRAFAGVYFSAIFVWRNFGVAAAGHALYDIFVG